MRALSFVDYIRWLRAAYLYYYEPEMNPGMSDHEWDELARAFHEQRANFPAAQYPILHDPHWDGGSLYWVKRHQYPPEVLS